MTAWLRPIRLAVVLLAVVLPAAACGNAQSGSGSAATAAGAVPADALFYADVNLDRESPAWKQFAAVGQRFPGWQRFVDQIVAGMNRGGSSTQNVSLDMGPTSSFKDDIEPWLGGTAGFAVTSVDAGAGKVHWIGFVASRDDAKAEAALAKSGSTKDGTYKGYTLYRSTDGSGEAAVGDHAVLVGDETGTVRDSIDLRGGGGDALTGNTDFTAAMAKLPHDSLLRGWANTQKLSELAGFASLGSLGASTSSAQVQQLATALGQLDDLTFAGWATNAGYHLTLRTTVKDGANPSLFAPQAAPSPLAPLVPADAFAFLAIHGYGQQLQRMLAGGGTALQLRQFQRQTGLSFQHDLIPLLSGDALLYAAPGVPVRAALLLKPADPAAAAATMHRLSLLVARSSPGTRVSPLPGGTGESITLANGLTVTWRRTPDGMIALGNDAAAGAAPAAPLAASSAYRGLLQRAGAPSGAAVSLYFDMGGLLKLLPIAGNANLRHLGGILAWSSHDGNDYSSDLFVEVR
ncbi:MAG TPA: DUF3352 domain-containing protein [Gaiellales bacterium]|nr:DUF3352 domain-containing protein [Gaiellales bacterium]